MKILDLLNEEQQHKTTGAIKHYSGKLKQSYDAFNDDKSGAFSSVKDDKTDPHMVKKYHHGPMDNDPDSEVGEDAYVYFALWTAKKNVSNPCLPRIYDIKKIKDRTGKFISRYQIEKLIPGSDLEPEELWHIMQRYFTKNEDFDATLQDVKRRIHNNHDMKTPILMMGRLCEMYIKGRSDSIKDESLKEALDLIREFLQTYKNSKHFTLDIENSGNIMFRRGPHGLQLVITDPVS